MTDADKIESLRDAYVAAEAAYTTARTAHAYVAAEYCNHGHYVATGKPVNHECRVIPPAALRAEMEGKYAEAIELMVTR